MLGREADRTTASVGLSAAAMGLCGHLSLTVVSLSHTKDMSLGHVRVAALV